MEGEPSFQRNASESWWGIELASPHYNQKVTANISISDSLFLHETV